MLSQPPPSENWELTSVCPVTRGWVSVSCLDWGLGAAAGLRGWAGAGNAGVIPILILRAPPATCPPAPAPIISWWTLERSLLISQTTLILSHCHTRPWPAACVTMQWGLIVTGEPVTRDSYRRLVIGQVLTVQSPDWRRAGAMQGVRLRSG